VAKASYWWKQIRYLNRDSFVNRVESTRYSGFLRSFVLALGQLIRLLARKDIRKASIWLLTAFGVAVMLAWNWKLVLATLAGVGLMLLVYFMQLWNWQTYWSRWRQFFTGSQGKLTLAVGSGGFAALGTYIAASIWADSENRWLAIGSILQGFGTFVTFLLLGWHVVSDRDRQDEAKLERLLQDLAAEEHLKRLIAVRQLSNLMQKPHLHQIYQQQLVEYFCVMLASEEKSIVREAILNSLHAWGTVLPKERSEKPIPIPLDLQPSHQRVYREI
jgi:hypothetical protein